jgi:hypothetical protein
MKRSHRWLARRAEQIERANAARLLRPALNLAVLTLCLGAVALPGLAHASSSSGMPWSSGMNQLSTEAKGGLAFIFILLGSAGGYVEYMNGGQLGMLLTLLGRSGLVIGVIGGLVTFASLFGMSAAVV